jgi:hypothetical protein
LERLESDEQSIKPIVQELLIVRRERPEPVVCRHRHIGQQSMTSQREGRGGRRGGGGAVPVLRGDDLHGVHVSHADVALLSLSTKLLHLQSHLRREKGREEREREVRWEREGREGWDLLVDVVEEGVPSAIKVAVQDEVSPLPGRVDSSALPHPALGDGLVRDKQRSLRGGGVLSPVQEDLSQRFEADDLFLQSLHPTLSLLKRRASNATARQGGMRSQMV